MKNTFETLIKIYSTSSRKAKGVIVKENSDDKKLLTLFNRGMDQYLTYGVSDKSFVDILEKEEFYIKPEQLSELDLDTLEWHDDSYDLFIGDVLPMLIETQAPSTNVIDKMKIFFKPLNVVERYFYYRIIIKNMNIGIGPKSINKEVGYILIKQYTPMLADSGMEKFDKWKFKDKNEYLVDTKINGLRLTIFVDMETFDVEIKTRSGRHFNYFENWLKENWFNDGHGKEVFKELNDIRNKLIDRENLSSTLKDPKQLVIDTELEHRDNTWESSIAVINRDGIELYDVLEPDEPLFHLRSFDLTYGLPFEPENFNKQIETLPLRFRRELLLAFKDILVDTKIEDEQYITNIFTFTDSIIVDNLEDVEKKAKEYITNGYEGAVVKDLEAGYICGRGVAWLKIKDITTYDGVIVEIMQGEPTGKYHNTAGKIMVKATIKGKELTGTCGSGFKEVDRNLLWNNKLGMIGRTVEFTVLGKTVKDNFQSGIFKGLRDDKTIEE